MKKKLRKKRSTRFFPALVILILAIGFVVFSNNPALVYQFEQKVMGSSFLTPLPSFAGLITGNSLDALWEPDSDLESGVLFDMNAYTFNREMFSNSVNVKPQGPGWGGRRIYLSGLVTEGGVVSDGGPVGTAYEPPISITFLNIDSELNDEFLEHFYSEEIFQCRTTFCENLVTVPTGIDAPPRLKVSIPAADAEDALISSTSGVLMQNGLTKYIGAYYDSRTIGKYFPWQERHNGTQKVINIPIQITLQDRYTSKASLTNPTDSLNVEFSAMNRIFALNQASFETPSRLTNAFGMVFRHKDQESEITNNQGDTRRVPLRAQIGVRLMQKEGAFYERIFGDLTDHPHVFTRGPANTSDPEHCTEQFPCKYYRGYGAQTADTSIPEEREFKIEVSYDHLKTLLKDANYPDTNPENYFLEYVTLTNEAHIYEGEFARNAFAYGGLKIEKKTSDDGGSVTEDGVQNWWEQFLRRFNR